MELKYTHVSRQPGQAISNIASEARILAERQKLPPHHFGALLDVFLEQTDSRLLSLAEVATTNEQQTQLFEVKSRLRQPQHDIRQLYCDRINLIGGIFQSLNDYPQINEVLTKQLKGKYTLLDRLDLK